MAEMAFNISGAGYGGFSAGQAFLAFKYDGVKLLYKAWCQSTGGATFHTSKPFNISNGVEGYGEGVLLDFATTYVVQIEMDEVFIGRGRVKFKFEINEMDSGNLSYSIERHPEVEGVSSGGTKITTTFNKLYLGDPDNETIWQNIWDGNLSILPPQ
jgi:hypothetical protein